MNERTRPLVVGFLSVILIVGAMAGAWSIMQAPYTFSAKPSNAPLTPTPFPIPPEAANDPALYNPGLASAFYANGPEWDRNLHPDIQRWVDWQRKIGRHALISAITGGDPAGVAAAPTFMLGVTEWDGSDLFELGIPRTVDGKPVVIQKMGFAIDY